MVLMSFFQEVINTVLMSQEENQDEERKYHLLYKIIQYVTGKFE